MIKEEYAKIYAFNSIIKQLDKASKDTRKRERVRASVALSHIKQWYMEGENDFEKRNSTKNL
jgi:predicted Co/Zn/Cd cation transporter (cation efflux family)